jgi:hypothetical protein
MRDYNETRYVIAFLQQRDFFKLLFQNKRKLCVMLRAGRSGDWIPVGARCSAPVQTGPGAHPASCIMGTVSFLGVKIGRGVTLTPHPFIVLWSWKNRAIPLLPLWAVWPMQSLSACTRVQCTFTFYTEYICLIQFSKLTAITFPKWINTLLLK